MDFKIWEGVRVWGEKRGRGRGEERKGREASDDVGPNEKKIRLAR